MADDIAYGTPEISVLLRNETNPPSFHGESNDEELFDGLWRQSGKKRRLSVDQVQFLEKSFDVENKLEPERKSQLARELGLQPRQVAIWFQNRRARCKTKQLEKDYASLRTLYENLKSDYKTLLEEEEKRKTEVANLKKKLAIREKGKRNWSTAEVGFDSENHSSMADSCHGFELEQSDFSQDEEDELSRNLLSTCDFAKLESCCYDEPPSSCCNVLGFQIEDQALGFWPY